MDAATRKQHPSVARSRFWREDVRWFGPQGVVDFGEPAVAWCLRGASQGDLDLYVMVNVGHEPVTFVLQDAAQPWHLAIDTSRPSPADIELERLCQLKRPSYMVAGHSVIVLVRPVADRAWTAGSPTSGAHPAHWERARLPGAAT